MSEGRDDKILISAQGLYKAFDELVVLDDISFKLHKGENVVVMGRSGTGKSVLLKCIVGLLYPDRGQLKVLGMQPKDLDKYQLQELRRKVGFLFQGGALYDSMTVRENLEFPLRRLREVSKSDRLAAAKEVLHSVGLGNVIDKMPSELSGGMKKRVALARTIILKPQIILYDEPTTGLDPITSTEISKLILKMREEYGIASLIVTHDVPCARMTGDRVMLMKDGKWHAEGKLHDLEKSDNEWVRTFLSNG